MSEGSQSSLSCMTGQHDHVSSLAPDPTILVSPGDMLIASSNSGLEMDIDWLKFRNWEGLRSGWEESKLASHTWIRSCLECYSWPWDWACIGKPSPGACLLQSFVTIGGPAEGMALILFSPKAT